MPGGSSHDPDIVRERFELADGATSDDLCRQVLELAGVREDYSNLHEAERHAFSLFALALGDIGGDPTRTSAGDLRTDAANAAGLAARSVPDDVLRSLAGKLYPQRVDVTPRALLVAIGRRVLASQADPDR